MLIHLLHTILSRIQSPYLIELLSAPPSTSSPLWQTLPQHCKHHPLPHSSPSPSPPQDLILSVLLSLMSSSPFRSSLYYVCTIPGATLFSSQYSHSISLYYHPAVTMGIRRYIMNKKGINNMYLYIHTVCHLCHYSAYFEFISASSPW